MRTHGRASALLNTGLEARMNPLVLAALAGVLVGGGLWSLASTRVSVHPRLADAIDLLDGQSIRPDEDGPAEGIDRIGAWLRFRRRHGVPAETLRRLRINGISVDRYFTHKVLWALGLLLGPTAFTAAMAAMLGAGPAIPVALALAAGLLGFFVPDLMLRQGDRAVTADATEALLTFFDLVTLERLANQSATQALRAAAGLSDAPVFAAIRDALERARLEQRAPYAELQRLGAALGLPALVDIADVMRLDESGASLSGALRARVKELRDAHLTSEKIAASAVSERMAFFMVVPSLVFGAIFVVPPLLRLLSS